MNYVLNPTEFDNLSELSREKVCLIQQFNDAHRKRWKENINAKTFDNLYDKSVAEIIMCITLIESRGV